MSAQALPAEVKPKRYHPALVTLHWLVMILVFLNLYLGLFDLRPALQRGRGGFQIPTSVLAVHMATGIAILALVVIRFIVRSTSKRPADATSGNTFLDGVAKLIHYALYFFLILTTIVGLTFAIQTRRLQTTFLGEQPRFGPQGGFNQGGNNPGNFPGGNNSGNSQGGNNPGGFQGNGNGNPGFPRGGRGFGFAFFLLPVHLWIAYILSLLIVIHIGAALYHQFILKDNLIARMWFGKNTEA